MLCLGGGIYSSSALVHFLDCLTNNISSVVKQINNNSYFSFDCYLSEIQTGLGKRVFGSRYQALIKPVVENLGFFTVSSGVSQVNKLQQSKGLSFDLLTSYLKY